MELGPPLSLGTSRLRTDGPIEVWCESYQRWVRGFEIAGHTGGGYLVRRSSDASVLPVPFADENVRRVEPGGERTAW